MTTVNSQKSASSGAQFVRKNSLLEESTDYMSDKVKQDMPRSNGEEEKPSTEMVIRTPRTVAEKKAREGKTNSVFDTEQESVLKWKRQIIYLIDHMYSTIVMMLITVWALFGDDIRLINTNSSADHIFADLTVFCLVMFSLELVLSSLAKKDYFLGFYFYLDFIATASLIFDLPAVASKLEGSDAADGTSLARAGRTSRAGTRAGRIVRLVRLVRFLKVVNQYKKKKSGAIEKVEEKETAESRVGQKLSDLTTRRVIIGVLGMLFILPMFEISSGYYGESSGVDAGGLSILHILYSNSNNDMTSVEELISTYKTSTGFKLSTADTLNLFYLSFSNNEDIHVITDESNEKRNMYLRYGEQKSYIESTDACHADPNNSDFEYRLTDECFISEAKFNFKYASQFQAYLNIYRTLFICLILGLGSLLFSKDANNLVLLPIERMIQKVKEVSENPLKKMEVQEDDGNMFETRILENSIAKIASLLAVGFGEAGAEVIASNMKNGGELDPMLPGKKMVAIFGFCDIRQFTDATEVLQEEVMEYVNAIGKIVHMEVHLHKGSANKNIGDAFLLVWKLPVSPEEWDDFDNISEERKKEINIIADAALASFIIIQAGIKKSAKLKPYTLRNDLNARMPNFAVKMGFGLHAGWAIEGAIGSSYKIDASYLSPNVNMAARLEAATKQFGTPLLLSEDFVGCLTGNVVKSCRQIDRVTVKGSVQPMGLYTYDVNVDSIPEAPSDSDPNYPAELETCSNERYGNEFTENPDIINTKGATPEFLTQFAEGFNAYRNGKWELAKDILEECHVARTNGDGSVLKDGPTATLLAVMAEFGFRSPQNWRGYRELTEK